MRESHENDEDKRNIYGEEEKKDGKQKNNNKQYKQMKTTILVEPRNTEMK